MRSLRMLMLGPYPVPGALPRLVPLLADALRREGHQVDLERWGRHAEVETTAQKLRGRLDDLLRIRARLKRSPCDVLFVTTSHDWNTIGRDVPLMLAARRHARHIILHIHGTLTEWLEPDASWARRAASSWLVRLSDAILVSSRDEREAFARFAPSGRFVTVDNIYAPDAGSPIVPVPEEWGLPAGKPVVFFAGRLVPEKGVLELLDAWPDVARRTGAHLLLAGVGPLEATVAARFAASTLGGTASWVKYLSRPLLEAAYRAATVFVLPSYHAEGFPAVIQDAVAHGLPIVTTKNRGVADHLVDGVHARYVRPRSAEAIGAALVELLQDAALREGMRAANLAKAQDFSPETVVRQYLGMLEQVAGDRT